MVACAFPPTELAQRRFPPDSSKIPTAPQLSADWGEITTIDIVVPLVLVFKMLSAFRQLCVPAVPCLYNGGKGKAVRIGRGPATVIGEPHPLSPSVDGRPLFCPVQKGKAEDVVMTREPGNLPGNLDLT